MERDLESAQAKIKYLEFDQKSNREDEKYKIKYEKLKVKKCRFYDRVFVILSDFFPKTKFLGRKPHILAFGF